MQMLGMHLWWGRHSQALFLKLKFVFFFFFFQSLQLRLGKCRHFYFLKFLLLFSVDCLYHVLFFIIFVLVSLLQFCFSLHHLLIVLTFILILFFYISHSLSDRLIFILNNDGFYMFP